MDIQSVRERLLTGFRPREKDIDTPYLEELDGQLKLVGLSGKQRIELEKQATVQTIDKDGNTINKFDPQKFIALATSVCLRLRSTGERVLKEADVLGESGNGTDGALLEADDSVIRPLFQELSDLVGNRSIKETKNVSGSGESASLASSSLQDSEEPLTNSLAESTQTN